MSITKSSVINLYDAVSGDTHFQTKVNSDMVKFKVSGKPIKVNSSEFSIVNDDGVTVENVAQFIQDEKDRLTQEVSDREAAVTAEATARSAVDDDLQAQISLRAHTTYVNSKNSARKAETDQNAADILTEQAARSTAVNLEISNRSSADAVLQAAVDAETVARVADTDNIKDDLLPLKCDISTFDAHVVANQALHDGQQTAINNRYHRNTVDGFLALKATVAALDSEVAARGSADVSLGSLITAEETARLAEVAVERGRIDSLLDGTTVDLNQLSELVTAYQTSDTNILTQIANINTTIASIQSQLSSTDTKLDTLLDNIDY